MPRKGLSMNEIVNASVSLVEEKGIEKFSLREVASRLGVKPASLYNHVANVEELINAVGHVALNRLHEKLCSVEEATDHSKRLLEIADRYREYALGNQELYKAIVRMPSYEDEALMEEGYTIIKDLYHSLEGFKLDPIEKINFGRAYRSAMHGFISLEMNGYFQKEPDTKESYHFLMNQMIKALRIKEE